MKQLRLFMLGAGILALITSCKNDKENFDATGAFESVEVIISSEANGAIEELNIEEGQVLKAGEQIGYVDSIQLYLQKKQLEAQIQALLIKKPDIAKQIGSLEAQLKSARVDQMRIKNLARADAATQQQLDDINTRVSVLKKQIEAQESTLGISTEGIGKETVPLHVQIYEVNDQLNKCRIINPQDGTVLVKYAEAHEMTATGKPLYKIADLSTINLRAYVSGNQLPQIKLRQSVKVLTDDGKGGYKETTGTIIWISDKAEFTPKTIQTKEERADKVYAIKVEVKNDGTYKIGMYGQVRFE